MHGNRELTKMSQELAGAARIEAFSAEETASQMNQVAALIVENRGEVQGAWAASQQLEQAAQELDKLVKNFE
jgi:methyl-accepting chemotaxis protein